MTSYSRLRLILDSHPGAIYSLNTRITQAGLSLPDRSMVVLASEVKDLRGSLPGEYAVSFRPSRRNQRKYNPQDYDEGKDIYDDMVRLLRKLNYPSSYKPRWDSSWSVMTSGSIFTACFAVKFTGKLSDKFADKLYAM